MSAQEARAELARRELVRRGKGSIDFGKVVSGTGKALLNPSASDMAQNGLDSAQRAGQAALGSIYSQGKEALTGMVPNDIKESMGKGVTSTFLPPFFRNFVPSQIKRDIGKAGVGVGIDIGAGLSTEGIGPAAKLASKVTKGVGNMAEEAGGRALNFYIKPRQAAYSFGRNPGKAVARNIGPQLTRENLLNAINSKTDELLKNMEGAVKNSKTPVDITPVREHFKKIVSGMKDFPETYSGPIEAHKSFARDLDNILRKEGVTISNGKMLVTPQTAVKIKRAIGKLPSWSMNDPKLGSLTKTARESYGAFDKSIDKAVPETRQLNEDISGLIGAGQGIEKGMMREQNKSPVGLLELAGGAVASGGQLLNPAFLAGAAGVKTLRSAPFNTAFGATGGAIGRGARLTSDVLDQVKGPGILSQIADLFKTPEGPQRLLNGPEVRLGLPEAFPREPINNQPLLRRNRASEVARQLPDAVSTGASPIEVPGSSTIEMPEILDSDITRMAEEFGIPTYGDGPRSRTSNIPKTPRGFVDKNIMDILKRRKKFLE